MSNIQNKVNYHCSLCTKRNCRHCHHHAIGQSISIVINNNKIGELMQLFTTQLISYPEPC